MNFAAMRQDVRTVVMDDLGRFISDDDIEAWLNEAQRDLAARLGTLTKVVQGNVAANSKIPLPADLVEVHALKLAGYTTEAEAVDHGVFFTYRDETISSSVVLYRIFGGSIELWPVATGAAYTLEYRYSPADLVGDGDVSPFPADLHVRLVNYARAHACLKDGRQGDFATYMGLYERNLPAPSTGRAALIPAPITLGFLPGPFDTDDAAHIG